MKELSQVTAIVVDNELFQPIAHRLARDFRRVLYFTEWEKARKIEDAVAGDGFPDIERCFDYWEVKDEVDLWVFPDVGYAGLQKELESQGRLVWGTRDAGRQETDRALFLKTLKRCGLNVPPHDVVMGLVALRKFLEDAEDVYIKISRYRGSFETSHFRNMKEDRGLLDLWGVKFGPVSEKIPFLVFHNIDTPLELGADLYRAGGKWPSLMLNGIEWKDRSYFAAVTKREDMPQQIQDVLECYGEVLDESRYAGQFSMEMRLKDEDGYFIDPTCRGGLPSTASQLTLWRNFSEIVYRGAQGEMVEPEAAAQFSAESIVTMKGDNNLWRTAEIPVKLDGHLLLAGCCMVDGVVAFAPDDDDTVGWLVNTGDDQKAVILGMNELADELPDGMDANTECLAYVLKEIHEAEKQGVEFSNEPTPEPAVVFEEAAK